MSVLVWPNFCTLSFFEKKSFSSFDDVLFTLVFFMAHTCFGDFGEAFYDES
jgi:hypothetical protein